MAKKTTKKSTKKATTKSAKKSTKKASARPTAPPAQKTPKRSPKPTSPSGPTPAAIDLDKALAPFHKRNWRQALERLQALGQKYPDSMDVTDRVRSYSRICERELANKPPTPKTAEDHYQLGVVRLNDGVLDEARTLLEQAVKLEADSDKAHYALASALALGEQSAEALQHLQRAIELNDDNRIFAGNDSDFELLRDEVQFLELTRRAQPAGSPD